MYLCKKVKKTAFYIAIISLCSSVVFAGNIYINKNIVSNDSRVYGNMGIVVNGKKLDKPVLVKKVIKENKKISFPSTIKKIIVDIDDCEIVMKKGKNYILMPYGKKNFIKSSGSTLTIKGDTALSEGKIKIFTNSVEQLILKGDIKAYISLKVKNFNVKLFGDGYVEFSSIANIGLDFYGDAILKLNGNVEKVILKGSGDITILSKDKDFLLYKKNVDGEITIE